MIPDDDGPVPSPGKGGGRVCRVLALLLLFGLLVPSVIPLTVAAEVPDVPPGDPAVGRTDFHQIIMTQGDDPDTEEKEPRNLLVVTDRTFWRIPWDSDEVYTYIPPDSENVLVDHVEVFEHQDMSLFIPGDYSSASNPHDPPRFGKVGAGPYEGMAYWGFPAGADRTKTNNLVFETDEDWEDFDPNHTDGGEWKVLFNSLSLDDNVTSATYTSKMYTGGVDIVSINMSVLGFAKENMSFEVTWNNGTMWSPIVEGTPLPADGPGTGFRWRVTMTQNETLNTTPVLDGVAFRISFIPEATEVWLETVYHVRVPAGKAIEIGMVFPFDVNFSGMILVAYFDNDMRLEVNGTTLTSDPDGTYPGKTTYLHMRGPYEKALTFTVTDLREPDDEPSTSWLLFAVLLVILLAVGVAYTMRGGSGRADGPRPGPGADADVADGAEGEPGERGGMTSLERSKAEILEEISKLDLLREQGVIDEEEHRARRAELKARAVEVMKRMDGGA